MSLTDADYKQQLVWDALKARSNYSYELPPIDDDLLYIHVDMMISDLIDLVMRQFY
jgi:hypothetical protein